MKTKISGINGTNNILSSQAKGRVENGMIDKAVIYRSNHEYFIQFDGPNSDWKGEKLVLCSVREPYEYRKFKTIDGAVAECQRIGITEIGLDLT